MSKRTFSLAALASPIVSIVFSVSSVLAEEAEPCKELMTADFSTIQDAPAQVTDAKVVEAAGEQPAHCRVQGYIWPQIRFAMRLPAIAQWNGKFFEAGIGGLGGRLAPELCADPLRRGYACITSDKGPTGGGLDSYNDLQSQVDLGIRAAHVAALAGRAITQHHYGRKPQYSYFMGCSGGGIAAMVEAQYFLGISTASSPRISREETAISIAVLSGFGGVDNRHSAAVLSGHGCRLGY